MYILFIASANTSATDITDIFSIFFSSRKFANNISKEVPIAIIDKRRPKPNVSEVMNIIGEVRDKNVILLDDMIDTAGTIVNAAEALKKFGARMCMLAVLMQYFQVQL